MPSLDDVGRAQTRLAPADLEWLHRLVADWQIIADLSFADLVLWLPDAGGRGFWAGAQMRPTTGPTAYVDDLVGAFVPTGRRPMIDAAWSEGRICREGDPEWRDHVPVRVETIPVRRSGHVLGVIARNTNLLGVRTPSRLELAYLQTAVDLTKMISEGQFPTAGERSDLADAMRVGDGFVRTDPEGRVEYASPNAISAFRRLGATGDLVGLELAEVARELVPAPRAPVAEAVWIAVSGRMPKEAELENAAASLVVRSIPLLADGRRTGALTLIRDVTELRLRERELITREATIREIHHRVKNNLQTVAALLRLQARRTQTPDAHAALEEAVRRVGTIAIVHETLSEGFDEVVAFDEVADRLVSMVAEVTAGDSTVRTNRSGSFGRLPASIATPLAMVLTEIVQNAVTHGLRGGGGRIGLRTRRTPSQLVVDVEDDGAGLPDGFDPWGSTSLGLSIVRTLVEGELGGTIEFGNGVSGGGAAVSLRVPLTEIGEDPDLPAGPGIATLDRA
ncbi:MAG: histidine kinase N-terminal domain-containing protein [Nocardioidaceae bacterium]